jgi:hypothetical protein
MATADEIVQHFSAPAGFKKYIGFLGGKRAAKSTELFNGAERRGAARNYMLDSREHEDVHYDIVAFSTGDGLSQSQLDDLTRQAQLVPLGTLRYEGMLAATLPDAFGSNAEANDINALSDPAAGVFVLPITKMKKSATHTWTLWAAKDGEFFVYPVEDRKIGI